MSIARRLDALGKRAQEAGKGPDPAIVLDLGEDGAIVDGERLTRAEFEARWPRWRPTPGLVVGNIDLIEDF
jgi:hypothetical protein